MLKISHCLTRYLVAARFLPVSSGLNSSRLFNKPLWPVVAEQQHPTSTWTIHCRQKSSSSSCNNQSNGDNKKSYLNDMASDTIKKSGVRTRSQTEAALIRQDGVKNRSDNTLDDSTQIVGTKKDRLSSLSCPSASKSSSAPDHLAAGSVRHDKKSRQFILDLDNNQVARIDYKRIGKNYIDLYHTEVPEGLRGRGFGRALAEGALENALRANYKLKVTCEYLQHYLDSYADEKHRKLVD